MTSLTRRFQHELRRHRLVEDGDHILVAVSGGPDSVGLLHLLAEAAGNCRLSAVHVEHRLRPGESEKEQRLVQDHCRRLQIDCRVAVVDVPAEHRKSGESVEACARRLRYRVLEEVRREVGADLIGVGHTSDDQAEEVLIRLLRGTGLQGLAGMAHKSGRVIRPLLDIGKQEIVAYLESRAIAYCLDSSNLSRRFLRNRVRLDLLPLLERDFNPAIKKTLLSMAEVFRDDDDYLEQQVARLLDRVIDRTGGLQLAIPPVLALHPALQRRLLEKICWQSGCRPTAEHIKQLLACLMHGEQGAELHLPQRITARKIGTNLVFQQRDRQRGSSPPETLLPPLLLTGEGVYEVPALAATISLRRFDHQPQPGPGELIVDGDRVRLPLTLRAPRAGERFWPLGAPGSKKIRRYFSDRKIPVHSRDRIPILGNEEMVVAIPGLAIAEPVKITATTRRFLLISWNSRP